MKKIPTPGGHIYVKSGQPIALGINTIRCASTSGGWNEYEHTLHLPGSHVAILDDPEAIEWIMKELDTLLD